METLKDMVGMVWAATKACWEAMQSAWKFIDGNADAIVAVATVLGLIYAARQFRLAKRKQQEQDQPYVYIDMERATGPLFDLVICNNGNSPAVNIHITFDPNIQLHSHSQVKINDYKIMNNLRFLAPGKDMRFFFGSLLGGNTVICQEFKVVIEYDDLQGYHYKNEQTLDPRDMVELTRIDIKGEHELVKSIQSIEKLLQGTGENMEAIRDGIRVSSRGNALRFNDYSTGQLLTLLKNIQQHGTPDGFSTDIDRQDVEDIAIVLREKLLMKAMHTPNELRLVQLLNVLVNNHERYSSTSYFDALNEIAGMQL